MAKSTKSRRKRKPRKPSKPSDDFPMWPHPSGRWCRKHKDRFFYFGPWDDPDGALSQFNQQWPYIEQEKEPPAVDDNGSLVRSVETDGCTIRVLCNDFLNNKREKMDSEELSPVTFRGYYRTCETLVNQFGKDRRVETLKPADFQKLRAALAERFGVVGLKNYINLCRIVFKYASDHGLIEAPVKYGQGFDRPKAKALRKARNAAGPRLFESGELRTILEFLQGNEVVHATSGESVTSKANPVMRAMVLLALNCGFGNTDIASLPQTAIDWETGWIEFPRPKTEIPRRISLWPETLDALRAAIKGRPDPKDRADSRLCFLTNKGRRWVRAAPKRDDPEKIVAQDALSPAFAKVLKALGINGRKGLGFYTMRHVVETVGGECRDQVAVDALMGHVDSSMGAAYRERISDERLRAPTDAIHAWLWPPEDDE